MIFWPKIHNFLLVKPDKELVDSNCDFICLGRSMDCVTKMRPCQPLEGGADLINCSLVLATPMTQQ